MRVLIPVLAALLFASCVSSRIRPLSPEAQAVLELDRARVHYNRAWAYQGFGFPADSGQLTRETHAELLLAVTAADEVARLRPQSGVPHAFLAALFRNALRSPEVAIMEINQAIELGDLGKMGAESYSMRAELYRDLGNEQLYSQSLKEAETKFPGHFFVEDAKAYHRHDSAARLPASAPLAKRAPGLEDSRSDGSLTCSSGWTSYGVNGEVTEESYKLSISYVPEDKFHQVDLTLTRNGKTENSHYVGFCFMGNAKPDQRLATDLAVTFVCLDSELDWLGTGNEESYSAMRNHTFLSSRVRAGTDFGTRGPASAPKLLGSSFAWLQLITKNNGKDEILTEMNPESCTAK